ncbi:hypothetical protein OB955_04905 [Halobacteria archaeon AArc-m2/3/4]|uniref:Uncharacterized protein n=1 Tax=Natronoglomus mannanivorans TaxID=2979990 RepID=A0AAP3E5C9_9EURY|nr:hypothetical protein [Halobacteria archaeon AArc-xg1-1]MCU4972073.1 hypothetical protein [Halobacteria archaeon AArc-m2/3/4]
MTIAQRIGAAANRPAVAGAVFGLGAIVYMACFLLVVSPWGPHTFIVSGGSVVAASGIATGAVGWVVWRVAVPPSGLPRYRTYGFLGFGVGIGAFVTAPPLAMILWSGVFFTGVVTQAGILAPIILVGWLFNALAWGFVGTLLAVVLTAGLPPVFTAALGLLLGYFDHRFSGDTTELRAYE